VATIPRIPQDYVDAYSAPEADPDNPASHLAPPLDLVRLAGIPVQTRSSFRLDPVLHEMIRIYNGKVQDCQYCQNARRAVAVQAGLTESMVDMLSDFENSDLADDMKAALRLTAAFSSNPGVITEEMWGEAAQHFSAKELVDIVLLSMQTIASKVTVTLGLDPGKESSDRIIFPTEDVLGESAEMKEAIEALRAQGVMVENPSDVPLRPGTAF
jgi:hypothetical protein